MGFRDEREALRARVDILEGETRELRAHAAAQHAEIRARIERAIELLEASDPGAASELREAASTLSEASRAADRPPSTPYLDAHRRRTKWIALAAISVLVAGTSWLLIQKWGPKPVPEELAGARLGMTAEELEAAFPAVLGGDDAMHASTLIDEQPAECSFTLVLDDRVSKISCDIPNMATRQETDALVDRFVRQAERSMGWPDFSTTDDHGSWRRIDKVWRGRSRAYVLLAREHALTLSIERSGHLSAAVRRREELEAAQRRKAEDRKREARERQRERLKQNATPQSP